MAKLTESDVLNIRSMLANGYSPLYVSLEYGLHIATVHEIGRRKTWRHI